ncbi:unnamed protein product, partial [Rotaria sp. Silwood2]
MPIQTLKVGSLGTHNLLGLAKEKKARMLIASTSEVYGDPTVHPQPEEYWGNVNPVGPRGVYDEAKRFQEAITMAYHNFHGVETRIIRIFNTYGPRMRLDDGRALPAFMSQALNGEDLTMFGDGSQTRSFCYVSDLVEEPYYYKEPWSRFLENKKVLVIHPFEKTIQNQYKNHHLLFADKNVFPSFELKTLKAVQSLANNPTEFNTWFDALDYMKSAISKIDFDIAIIGAGAYGLPLAAPI